MEKQRVFVTGAGVVSAAGTGKQDFWSGLLAPAPAAPQAERRLEGDARPCRCATVDGFDVEEYLETPKAYLDRASELAFAGASLALEDADLDRNALAGDERVGLMLGSAYGNQDTMALFFGDVLAKGPRFAKPFLFPHTYANTSISLLAMEYGIIGPHLHFASGSIAGGDALLAAYDAIRGGQADLVLAGGFEALSDTWLQHLAASHRLCHDRPCAPFDTERSGLMAGEGCAILILESAAHAAARGVTALGELRGAAAFSGPAAAEAPDEYGAVLFQTMTRAVAQAGLAPDDVDWICALSNGSANEDRGEMLALQQWARQTTRATPISSLQSRTGETFGAGSALQTAAALGALQSGTAPGTAHLENSGADPEGPDLHLLSGRGLQADMRNVLVNSGDPGGAALCLVLARAPQHADQGKEAER